jgi:hypothetical protein
MTKGPIKNLAASVHQRLLNVAKQSNRRFNDLVQYYALERWLCRLAHSPHAQQFVLKGALLLTVWKTSVTRPTRDIDLLGCMNNDLDAVRAVVAEINQSSVEPDGLVFDPADVTTERIAEDADYMGVRAKFHGRLGNTRVPMQIDIGFSDAVVPSPVHVIYPTILGHPGIELRAYNRETAIAEKFEAMVKLGELNSRMKDFFDIWLLGENFAFDGAELAAAVQATFARRGTLMERAPVCFSDRFAQDRSKAAQWHAFARRALLMQGLPDYPIVIGHVRDFLQPVAVAVLENRAFSAQWPAGGPWSART